MDHTSLKAKGVAPLSSEPAVLTGWKLLFNVHHFFRHEGGMANIEPTLDSGDRVLGILHLLDDAHLAALDEVEAYGIGYDRIDVDVMTETGLIAAVTYVGIASFLDDNCLPTQRYINILVKGATNADLEESYIDMLRLYPRLQKKQYPKFTFPEKPNRVFDASMLAKNPLYTAIHGAVFDMSNARWEHEYVKIWFGGKDVTLFHLKRMDSSDGSETLDDIANDQLDDVQRHYLNEYLHEFNDEYEFVGRYVYDFRDSAQDSTAS